MIGTTFRAFLVSVPAKWAVAGLVADTGASPSRALGSDRVWQESGKRALWVGRAHQSLPNQDSGHTLSLQLAQLLGPGDAGLRDNGRVGGHPTEQTQGAGDVHAEVAQVSIVDADQSRPDARGRGQLVAVVHLHEHVQAELDG